MTLKDILGRLNGVKGSGTQYTAKCPAHDDRHASLSVGEGQDGRILLKCHAGCSTQSILAAMGLSERDLFPNKPDAKGAKAAKASDAPPVVATYNYYNAEGAVIAQKLRRADKTFLWRRPDGNGGWIYNRKDVPPVLYTGEWRKVHDVVYLVEGEKDVDTLYRLDQTAVSGMDGAGPGKWREAYTEQLRGKVVYILPDNDAPGMAYAEEAACALSKAAKRVTIADLSSVWPEMPEHADVTDLLEKFGTYEGWRMVYRATVSAKPWKPRLRRNASPPGTDGTEDRDAWEPPIPFEEIETPDFPVDCLPGPLSDFVECLADSTQTPEEMAGVLALGVLATAFQSKYMVEVTPDWQEPLCLWPVAVAAPGERKSAVIAALIRPMEEYQAERRRAEAVEIAQNQAERKLLEGRLAAVQRADKKVPLEEQQEEAYALSAQLAEFEERHPFRLLVDDTTTEKLADIMEMQGGCITVASAEGGVFDAMSGRYDKSANFDVYLKGHAGDSLSVDRITRNSNYIPKPRLTMLLTVQPIVLSGLMGNATLKGKGMCGRFLYAMCRSKVGRRKVDPPSIPPGVKNRYCQFIRQILDDTGRGMIRLSDEADMVRMDYQSCIEKRLGAEWEFMQDWGGKLVGACVRIAALIHAGNTQGEPGAVLRTSVSGDTMSAAVKIGEFLSMNAEAAYKVMGASEGYEDAKYLWRRIVENGKTELSRRDLFNLCKGKFKTVEQMQPAFQILIERGFIREEERKTGGRPTKRVTVNPLAFNGNSTHSGLP